MDRRRWTDDEIEHYHERAALAEYHGGLPRAEAEVLALDCVERRRRREAAEEARRGAP